MGSRYFTEIVSRPEYEKVYVEIWLEGDVPGGELIAEVLDETEKPQIVLYPKSNEKPWILDYQEFMDAITNAKKRLFNEK